MARKIRLGDVTLSWHERNGQWRKSIGYKPDKTGTRRVPAEWYFGAEESAAVLRAAAKLAEWRDLVADWEVQSILAGELYPAMPIDAPFWLPEELEQSEGVTAEVESSRPENVSLAKAKDQFIAAMRARLSLMGPKGLKQSTFNTIVANLDRAILATTADGLRILPDDKLIHLIDHAVVAEAINFHYRKGGVSERTAMNYCRTLQQFLEWMDSQPNLRFQKPKGMDALFKLGKPATDPTIPTYAQVKDLYAACGNDDERLYVMLGINCGMYEVDISNLTPAAVVVEKGETYLWWRREKTSHQNTFHTLHWLFPETVKLIESQRAKANPYGRLFLNRYDKPISVVTEGYRTKAISDFFPSLVERAKLAGSGISFKSLRKFGAHNLRILAPRDKNDISRMYLGQKVPGVLSDYVRDDFGPLTAQLRRLREKMIAEKIWGPPRRGSRGA